MRRLNDTEAIVKRPLDGETTRTQSVRKIDNGYLVNDSEWNSKTGTYRQSERFCETVPGELESPAGQGSCGPEGLADTKKYLGEDV